MFATQDHNLWMIELRATKQNYFTAELVIHAIESAEEREASFLQPRKLIVETTLHRHVEHRQKLNLCREKEEAFFTNSSKEYVYGQPVVNYSPNLAKKMQFDKCLAV